MSDALRTLPIAFDRAERLAKIVGGTALAVTLVAGLMEQGMSRVLPDVKITAEPEIKRRWQKNAARLVPCGRH